MDRNLTTYKKGDFDLNFKGPYESKCYLFRKFIKKYWNLSTDQDSSHSDHLAAFLKAENLLPACDKKYQNISTIKVYSPSDLTFVNFWKFDDIITWYSIYSLEILYIIDDVIALK